MYQFFFYVYIYKNIHTCIQIYAHTFKCMYTGTCSTYFDKWMYIYTDIYIYVPKKIFYKLEHLSIYICVHI